MRETGRSGYQKIVKDRLKRSFPECMVHKLDPNEYQGIPDLLILLGDKWATLETKGYENAKHRPNQDYYVEQMNNMSFSRFIFPGNESEVFQQLEEHFYSD